MSFKSLKIRMSEHKTDLWISSVNKFEKKNELEKNYPRTLWEDELNEMKSRISANSQTDQPKVIVETHYLSAILGALNNQSF